MKHFPVFHIEDVFCLRVGGVEEIGDPALQHPVPCLSGPLFPCSGPIPEALGALTKLTDLSLSDNQLTGKPGNFVLVRLFFTPERREHFMAFDRVGFYNPVEQLRTGRVTQNGSEQGSFSRVLRAPGASGIAPAHGTWWS